MSSEKKPTSVVRFGLLALFMLSVLAFRPIRAQWLEFLIASPEAKYRYLIIAGWFGLALLFGLALYAWLGGAARIWQWIEDAANKLRIGWPLALLIVVGTAGDFPSATARALLLLLRQCLHPLLAADRLYSWSALSC